MDQSALMHAEKESTKEISICLLYKKVSRKFSDLIGAIIYVVYKIIRGGGGGVIKINDKRKCGKYI